jgi:N-acetylneuraminate synthase
MPALIIAEAGVNHNGDVELAHRLIDAAVKAGADAVKFQSFVTEELVTSWAPKAEYQIKTTGRADSQYEMLKSLELKPAQQESLKAHCDEAGILYLCTPYENASVDLLHGMGVAAFKIASTDTTNIPFLGYIASKGRPVLLSTGMSTLGEVDQAVEVLRAGGLDGKIILLHCTSAYPAPIKEANLRAISTLAQAFAHPVGFSDHTPGISVGPWAVAVGACVLEKHFTLDRTMVGPDHQTSLEPDEMAVLVHAVRELEAALGDGIKRPVPSERPNKAVMQKSLVASREIRAGQVIVADALACKRPATGLPPRYVDVIVGRKAAKDIRAGELIVYSSINWNTERLEA